MTASPRRAIAWFRRDLRMDDNRTLAAATGEAGRVWPVFVADPSLLESSVRAPARLAWFAASLAALDARLRVHGSGLTVLRGHPELVLPAFATTVGAEAVFAGRDEDPAATGRDRRVAAVLDLRLIDDQRLVPPGEIRSRAGAAYTVFSGFLRALEARIAEDMEPLACPARPDAATLAPRPAWDEGPEAFVAPAPPHGCRTPGRRRPPGCCATSAVTRWRRTEDRDRPGLAATSGLSAHLRVGAISVRACWRAAIDAARSADEHGDQRLAGGATMWRRQLAWREFLAHVIAAHPRLATEGFRRVDDALEWVSGPEAEEHLAAWSDGRTGFPFVDAGMRQLAATGWMHNRARLVTASFLVKDAGVDWRRGASVFAERLLDADVQQNDGNWQWVAGDAAPYFRILNPTRQARRFDPDGTYVRRWVPELADLPDDFIHEPWRAPSSRAPDYPAPILDHAEARERTLARYRAAAGA